jgi:hypothetical protein
MKNEESKIQQACVKWFHAQYPNVVMFAIPNGGKRGIVTAKIMKGEGVMPGCPDLFIAHQGSPLSVETIGCPGLFIEMKTPTGVLSKVQKEVHSKLEDAGYKVAVCRSLDEFMQTVNNYLR